MLRDADTARSLEQRYDIVFSTTSCPGDYAMLGLALSTLSGPIYVMACHHEEIPKFEKFHPRVKCLPMLPCDWLDPNRYRPKPWDERSIDVLMVAGWGPVKRHWHFFAALRSLAADTRVVLVGQPDGTFDRESIASLAKEYRVPMDLEILESLPIEDVTELQCDSRISAIFSRREGCCVAVTESLMADSPVALVEGAHLGPAAYINEKTGCFLPLRGTGEALRKFLEKSQSFSARRMGADQLSEWQFGKKALGFFSAPANNSGRTMDRQPGRAGLETSPINSRGSAARSSGERF